MAAIALDFLATLICFTLRRAIIAENRISLVRITLRAPVLGGREGRDDGDRRFAFFGERAAQALAAGRNDLRRDAGLSPEIRLIQGQRNIA